MTEEPASKDFRIFILQSHHLLPADSSQLSFRFSIFSYFFFFFLFFLFFGAEKIDMQPDRTEHPSFCYFYIIREGRENVKSL